MNNQNCNSQDVSQNNTKNISDNYIQSLLQNVKNQDNQIVLFEQIKKIMNFGIDKCVCKIKAKIKHGTGFFCNIPHKEIKVLITNNHIIDEDYLYKENRLVYSITEMGQEVFKEINLTKKRYKLTNKDYDFTIIEILKEDKINNYLEVNQDIFNKGDYLFSLQYPKGGKLQYSHGKLRAMKDGILIHDVGEDQGSSGSPIILMNNLKVIGT